MVWLNTLNKGSFLTKEENIQRKVQYFENKIIKLFSGHIEKFHSDDPHHGPGNKKALWRLVNDDGRRFDFGSPNAIYRVDVF